MGNFEAGSANKAKGPTHFISISQIKYKECDQKNVTEAPKKVNYSDDEIDLREPFDTSRRKMANHVDNSNLCCNRRSLRPA
jgi:hypothetical protein